MGFAQSILGSAPRETLGGMDGLELIAGQDRESSQPLERDTVAEGDVPLLRGEDLISSRRPCHPAPRGARGNLVIQVGTACWFRKPCVRCTSGSTPPMW